ncbi:MAG: FtsX-like permease family protein [Xanthomonadales bacterium]|nr:FtsX-like permease family protein [Xanthomonadales bacterium]
MTALNRKLLRDLWHVKSQVLAIVLVMASGIATFLMSVSNLDSLTATRERFYLEYRFADVFATLKRAPLSVGADIAEIDGVGAVELSIQAPMRIRLEGFADPVRGTLISLPDIGAKQLNRLYLRAGRMPEPYAQNEIVLGEAFATAHGLHPGDQLSGVVGGRIEDYQIVGIAISPEYVYQIQAGAAFPDFERYAIAWISRRALEAAYGMDGAFNSVALALAPDAHTERVIERLDPILEDYGGLGAIGRVDQLSHKFLSAEFDQLKTMATVFPAVFMSVAAFLLNVVFSRLISTQRDQIAILKAFGYSHAAIGWHYVSMVGVVIALGSAVGIAGGIWLGRALGLLYMSFYRFPYLDFVLSPTAVAAAIGISLAAALSGAAFALIRAARLPPAEAMRPEAPPRYRNSVLERVLPRRWLDQPTRMILRQLSRRPAKAVFTVLGIALAGGVLTIGMFQQDALNFMVDQQFALAQRNDLSVSFVEPEGYDALAEIRTLPGVIAVEGVRDVGVRLRAGPRSVLTGLQGLGNDSSLKRVLDVRSKPQALPTGGLLLTEYLAQMLNVRRGDRIEVDELQGARRHFSVPVDGTVREFIGINAYMELDALNTLLGEGERVSSALLQIDPPYVDEVYRLLEDRPGVAAVGSRKAAIQNFYQTMAESLLTFTFIATLLAGLIAFGVLYNTARIALGERGRELASLRVLGFTRGEVAYILVGELALLTFAAIPVGWVVGAGLVQVIVRGLQTELYRVPAYLSTETLASATVVVLLAALISALIVIHRVRHLDLVEVLKTRE